MVSYPTRPPEQNDGRLNVLIIDDKALQDEKLPDETEVLEQHYSPWFAVTVATGVDDVHPLFERTVGKPEPSPFDVYILDYRLCDTPACDDPDHLRNGTHADGAGLLLGIRAARVWPDHVQAHIPWSAFPKDGESILALTSAMSDSDTIHVTDPSKTCKVEGGPVALPTVLEEHAAPAYREALRASIVAGKAAFPAGLVDEISRLLDAEEEWVDADIQIHLTTPTGLRTLSLGALFFEMKKLIGGRAKVPSRAIRDLFSTPRPGGPIVERAKRLAELYWSLRTSKISCVNYSAIRHQKIPRFYNTVYPWLGDPMWRRGEHDCSGIRVFRLSITFLLLFEHRLRLDTLKLAPSLDDDGLKLVRTLEKIYHKMNPSFLKEGGLGEKAAAAFEKMLRAEEELKGTDMAVIDLSALKGPIADWSVLQLVDPLQAPIVEKNGSRKYSSTLGAGTKVSVGFTRLLAGSRVGSDECTLDPRELLLGDAAATRKMLLPEEWDAVIRFASELMPRKDFPAWLCP